MRSALPGLGFPSVLGLTACGFFLGSGAVLAGCPKKVPPVELVAQSKMVEKAADLTGAAGIHATVVGTLERKRPDGVNVDGTAIVLQDGTAVYVTEDAPPDGWDWMIGQEVRIQGVLWEKAPTGWPVPKLLEAEAPMPADVVIPM